MKRVMFIGYGSKARKVHTMLPKNVVLATIIASPRSADKIRAELGDSIEVITSINEWSDTPNLAANL